jgi:nucleotide-binding universal stress UspA family protein
MFKHILAATDFSEPAARATDYAIELATKLGAKLTLFHAYPVPPVPYGSAFAVVIDELAGLAYESMDKELAKVKTRVPHCNALVQPGSAGRGIVEAAEDVGADLIVLGTHGRSWLGAPLGGVASRVIRIARVPVLTVSPRESEGRDRSAIAGQSLRDDSKDVGHRT